jgi:hypothetical protein
VAPTASGKAVDEQIEPVAIDLAAKADVCRRFGPRKKLGEML